MRAKLLTFLPWLIALGVLAWVLRTVPLAETWAALRGLRPWQLGALVLANGLVLAALNGRWWLLLRALDATVAFGAALGYRLAAFGLSYFTPGPQFGGEPLQVLLVERRQGVPRPSALAAMTLDKALELLVNFAFLLLGVAVVVQYRLLGAAVGRETAVVPVVLFCLPVGFLVATWSDRRPLSRVMGLALLLPIWQWRPVWRERYGRGLDALAHSEQRAAALFRTYPSAVAAAVGMSLLAWLLMLAEFWLMVRFLGPALTPLQLVVTLTAVRLAFLLPLPGGLGALEASLVLAFAALGLPPALGISAALLIRARDVILGLVGLWWGSRLLTEARPV